MSTLGIWHVHAPNEDLSILLKKWLGTTSHTGRGGGGCNVYYEVSHAMRVDHLSAITSQWSGVLSLSRLLMRRSRLCYQPARYVAFSLSLQV